MYIVLRKVFAPFAVLCSCLVVGCTNTDGEATGGVGVAPPLRSATKVDDPRIRIKTLDDSMLDVARAVPSFGGMFFDDKGRLHVSLLDMSMIADAERAIAEVFGAGTIPAQGVVAGPADYSFAELKALHEKITPMVLSLEGTVLTDVHEADNRVKIGVENAAARRRVEELLARLGAPQKMLEIVEMAPILPASLQAAWRPVTGGLQIETPGKYCTLGFSASWGATRGIVGNSHCTQTQGGVEYTAVYQPTAYYNSIGTEVVDPVYSSGGDCPAGRVCRYTDSAFFATYEPGNPFIATTTGAWNLSISTWLRVMPEVRYPMQGQVVQKTGRTSGSTRGTIEWACATINSAGTPHTFYCNYIATNAYQIAAPGDSGSPVYVNHGSAHESDAGLTGILWGAGTNPWHFAFSPIGSIEYELGVQPDYYPSPDTDCPGCACQTSSSSLVQNCQ